MYVDNQATVHIVNSYVSSSRMMMRELCLLKRVLDRLGLHIQTECLPSMENRFADALSRRFPPGDLQMRRKLRRSVVTGMDAWLDSFPYRPLGAHPVFPRRQAWEELHKQWEPGLLRLLCPSVNLITPTLARIRLTGAACILLIPQWTRKNCY